MKSYLLSGRGIVGVLIIALALCITPAIPTQACDDSDYEAPVDGPVYIIISVDEAFLTPDLNGESEGRSLTTCPPQPPQGSATLIIEIGTFLAGEELGQTRFELADVIDLPAEFDWRLDGHPVTILGTFDTVGNTVHLVTPDDGHIPQAVEEAFHLASPFLYQMPEFPRPTTVELAQFIYDTAVGFNPALEQQTSAEEILQSIFVTGETLDCPEEGGEIVACEAEGDLFPHQPDERLFSFDFSIDPDDATLDVNMCIDVEIDIKPGNSKNIMNPTSNGVVWVAILTTDDFAAADEVDPTTVYLGDSLAKASKIQDANKDGDDDIVLKFGVADIGMDKNTTELVLTGMTYGDTCILGSDSVTVVPPKGKKKK